MISNFKILEENVINRVNYVAVFAQGSYTLTDLWTMTESEFDSVEKLVAEKLKLLRASII